MIEAAKRYKLARDNVDELKALLKAAQVILDENESDLIQLMADEGVTQVRLDDVGLLSMVTSNYLSVNAANKPGFYEYLKASGNGALLKEEVNPKTLTAFLRGHIDEIAKQLEADSGVDQFEAKEMALKFLNEKGASYFTERGISLRKA